MDLAKEPRVFQDEQEWKVDHRAPIPIDPVLEERGKTHGAFEDNAYVGQHLRDLFRSTGGWQKMTYVQREALDMMAGKISRILSGHGGFVDHWVDIAGYATLASSRAEK